MHTDWTPSHWPVSDCSTHLQQCVIQNAFFQHKLSVLWVTFLCWLKSVATRHIRSCLRGTQTVKFTLPGTVAQLSDHLLPVSCPVTASRLTLASQPHSGALCYESAVNRGLKTENWIMWFPKWKWTRGMFVFSCSNLCFSKLNVT